MLKYAWIVIMAGVLTLHVGLLRAQGVEASTTAAVIRVEGEINDYQRDYIRQRVADARRAGAGAVILEIDTYGGLVTSALDISRFLKQQDLPTVAYVTDKAISAGAMISFACGQIVMAPGTMIGDSAPIAAGPDGMQNLAPTERAKAESPVLADFLDSARRNGYDPQLAEALVRIGPALYMVSNEMGERKIVGAEEYERLTKEGWTAPKGVANPFRPKDTLLTLSAPDAQAIGVSKGTYANVEALAQAKGWRVTASYRPGLGDRLIAFLAQGAVRSVLLTILLIAGYMAFTTPGLGVPEAVAAIVLVVLLGVPLMTGYAQWYEIVMVLLGLALLAVEIFVLPGFGVAGIAGLALLLIGIILTFVGREPVSVPGVLPRLPMTWSAIQSGTAWVLGSLAVSLVGMAVLSRILPSTPFARRLILSTVVGAETKGTGEEMPAAAIRQWPKPGDTGTAVTDLRPGGVAEFHDPELGDVRSVDVISEVGFVAAGAKVTARVVGADQITVRKV